MYVPKNLQVTHFIKDDKILFCFEDTLFNTSVGNTIHHLDTNITYVVTNIVDVLDEYGDECEVTRKIELVEKTIY